VTARRERERLRWRCRRGMLELDLLFQRFLAREFDRLTDRDTVVLSRILELPDNELLDYCYGRREPDDPEVNALVRRIAG
jgi:succinate dehydrogenase flavin-adding protein (antitoxin of CptAB toxin-antitoxin module)